MLSVRTYSLTDEHIYFTVTIIWTAWRSISFLLTVLTSFGHFWTWPFFASMVGLRCLCHRGFPNGLSPPRAQPVGGPARAMAGSAGTDAHRVPCSRHCRPAAKAAAVWHQTAPPERGQAALPRPPSHYCCWRRRQHLLSKGPASSSCCWRRLQ